ncbi:MAG: iron-sulfur cluster assembly scaffold protein [Gammaproteobacteria bacterium]
MNRDPRYSPAVARHFSRPVNVGPLGGSGDNMFTGTAGRRDIGAHVRFEAEIEAGRILRVAFQAYGCPHTIAACSLATQGLEGAPAEALVGVDVDALRSALDVPVEKTGRLLIVQDALHDCFHAWENRRLADSRGQGSPA